MSAAGRGTERQERDLYKTPKKAFDPLVPYIKALGCKVWEPACGDRRLINWMKEAGIDAAGVDIADNPEFDYLIDPYRRDCTVTNPPFMFAFEFCKKAVAQSDHVFFLLRLNFLSSMERRDWYRVNEPGALFVLPFRPSFVIGVACRDKECGEKWTVSVEDAKPKLCRKCGGGVKITSTDCCEYSWFYFGKAYKGIIHL